LTFKEPKTLILGREKFQSIIIVVEMNPNMYDFSIVAEPSQLEDVCQFFTALYFPLAP